MAGLVDIAGDDIAALSDELTALVSVAPRRSSRRIQRRLERAFRRGGEDIKVLFPEKAGGQPTITRAVIRAVRSDELVGDIRSSDLSVIIHAAPLIAAGYDETLKQGARIVRFPLTTRAIVFTAVEEPQLFRLFDENLFYRGVFRG